MQTGRHDLPPFLVGITSISAQVILLRELLSRGVGNELSLTFDLAVWLGASAIGARFWSRATRITFQWLIVLGVGVALCALVAARALPLIGTIPGESAGPLSIAVLGLLVLLPTAFLTAGLFSVAARASPTPGRAYVAEAIGSWTGGLLTSALLFARAAPLSILLLFTALVLAATFRRPFGLLAALLLGAILITGLSSRLDGRLFSRAWESNHPGLHLIARAVTPTRTLVLSEREGERWLFADNVPTEVLDDPYRDERITAMLLAVAPRVESALLVDFGPATLAPAIARAGPERVVCLVPEREETLLVAPVGGIDVRFGDPRRVLSTLTGRYDLIALAGGETVTVASNRLWTMEMFATVASLLSTDGVLVAVTPGGSAAAGIDLTSWRGSVAQAMREAIGSVTAIDADDFILVASREPRTASLDPDSLAERFRRGGYNLDRYPPQRFAVEFPRDRIVSLPESEANRDFRPAAFRFALGRWVRLAGLPSRLLGSLPIVVGSLVALLLVAPVLRRQAASTPWGTILMATGAASLGMDLLVLMTYQAKVGLLQVGLGLLMGAFLGGTALGAKIGARRAAQQRPARFLTMVCGVQVVLALGATIALPLLPAGLVALTTWLAALLALLLGTTCGLPFHAVATRSSAAHAWATDAVGGILGAVLFLAFIGLGFRATGLALASLPLLASTGILRAAGSTR